MSLFAIYLENLILATDMIKIIGHRKEFQKRTFRAPALRLGESFAHQQVQRHTFFRTEPPIHLTCLCVIRQKTLDNKLLQSE